MSEQSCYHDFDSLLLIDWFKAGKGNLKVLRISGGSDEEDIEAWERINDEHQETFGTDKKHVAYLRLIKKIATLQLDHVITEDDFILNNIEIAQEQLMIMLKEITSNSGGSTSDTLFALSERAGYMVTESNITAKKFFEMIKYYNKKD
jgi:hypothetical protein